MAFAKRPIFIPDKSGAPFVKERMTEFEWFPGFSLTQAQRSIASLHHSGAAQGITPLLEISSKSTEPLGVALSAFNLKLQTPHGNMISVECAFQASKVFQNGGPYVDLYSATSKEAKTDPRLTTSGDLVGFRYFDDDFPTLPLTAFYDWLYLQALADNSGLADQLPRYRGFTDIRFNPGKSINCQAHSAALYVALKERGLLGRALSDRSEYLKIITPPPKLVARQDHLL